MKGQAFVIPETVTDVLQLLIFVCFFVGIFLLFTTYNFVVNTSVEEREAFSLVNVILGDSCLLYSDERNNYYRAIFDKSKLDSGSPCVDLSKFSVVITDFQEEWKFGTSQTNKKYSLPITVFDGQNFKIGKMVIGY